MKDLALAIREAEEALANGNQYVAQWNAGGGRQPTRARLVECVVDFILAVRSLLSASRDAAGRIRERESRANAREAVANAHMEFRYRAEAERDRLRKAMEQVRDTVNDPREIAIEALSPAAGEEKTK